MNVWCHHYIIKATRMGCNESKGCLINGDGVSSHYTYHPHHHHLGRKKTTTTPPPIRMPSSLVPDIEIQAKTGNDHLKPPHNHASATTCSSNSSSREQPPNFVEAPSFKDYLLSPASSISNNDDHHHHITNNIIHYEGSSDDDDDYDDVEEEEEKRRIETPDNSAYASAGEAFPIPFIREEPANMNDAIVGEVCLLHIQRQSVHQGEAIVGEACMLPPRDSTSSVKKRKVKGRQRHDRS